MTSPIYRNGSVVATCPDCAAPTTFEPRDPSREFGSVVLDGRVELGERAYNRTLYILMRCATCHRGGLAKIYDWGRVHDGTLVTFLPTAVDSAPLPENAPDSIKAEFREAELCSANGAYRGASALLRSVLEKTLKANGYTERKLIEKIDAAAGDGVLTESRRKRAHDEIRDLGNDVLHEDWRLVTSAEVDSARLYAQRIMEDFYDQRETVEKILIAKGRLPDPAAAADPAAAPAPAAALAPSAQT